MGAVAAITGATSTGAGCTISIGMGIAIGAAIILSTTESPVPVPTTTGDVVGDSVTGSTYPLHCVSYCGFCKHC